MSESSLNSEQELTARVGELLERDLSERGKRGKRVVDLWTKHDGYREHFAWKYREFRNFLYKMIQSLDNPFCMQFGVDHSHIFICEQAEKDNLLARYNEQIKKLNIRHGCV